MMAIIVNNVTIGMSVKKNWRITEEEDIMAITVSIVTIGMSVKKN